MAGLIQKSARRFTTQIGAAGVADAAVTTIPLVSVTGLPTDTVIELIIDRSDSSGVLTPSKEEVVRGTVSGTNLINCTRGVEGTAQAHSAGATVNALLTASMWNNMSQYIRDMPSRGLIGGIIQPTVAGNNLTVAVKTLTGNDPSANDPVYVWINNTLRSITGALSITRNAGTNWFNSGSAELATREIDYFVYMGFNATDGVTLGFSRIPYARLYSDFNTTTTNERHCAISTITNAAAGDNYVNVGRFAATLSASASFNWSVPAFTNANLIQEPVYETRKLSYVPVLTSTMGLAITAYQEREYIIRDNTVEMFYRLEFTTSGVATNVITSTIPISASNVFNIGNLVCNRLFDGGNTTGVVADTGVTTNFNIVKSTNWNIGTLRYAMISGKYTIS